MTFVYPKPNMAINAEQIWKVESVGSGRIMLHVVNQQHPIEVESPYVGHIRDTLGVQLPIWTGVAQAMKAGRGQS